ncbi:MAG: peptidoglycan-binding protein [Deltaproteobacteria bacterium]|nr:peptidoglycan-binding protein [Deltaproteobacteria bacterium]
MVADVKSRPTTTATPVATTTTAAAATPAQDPDADAVDVARLPQDTAGSFVAGTARTTILSPVQRAENPKLAELPAGLKKGAVGPQVTTLQESLRNSGYEVPKNGQFDAATEKQVKLLQRERGLPVSGVADAETLKALTHPAGEALAEAKELAGLPAEMLAAAASAFAEVKDGKGYCASGVHSALDAAELGGGGGDAYQYGDALAARSDMKEIEGLANSDLDDLPPGAIIVYGKNENHKHGHVTVVSDKTDSSGRVLEASDHLQPVNDVGLSSSYGTDFGGGPTPGPRFRVFMPVRGPAEQ